jgi:diguanylate cyclase (GGDEF)-like protein
MTPLRRIALLTMLLVAVSATCWSVVPVLHAWSWPGLELPVLFYVAFVVAERAQAHVEIRRQTFSLSLIEIPLLLGVFLLPAGWLLVSRLLAGATILVWRRTASVKARFNLALWALEPTLAVICVHALSGGATQGPRAWIAGAVTLLVVDVVDSFAVIAAMSVMQSRVQDEQVRMLLPATALSGAVNGTIGLIALVLVEADTRSLALLTALGVILVVSYKAYSGLLRRHANLDRLAQFTEAVATADAEPTSLARAVLDGARAALRAEFASLCLGDPESGYRRFSVREGRPSVCTEFVEPGETPAAPPDGIVVPLVGKGAPLGTLEVAERFGDIGSFDADDVRFLQALAAHAAVALDHQALLDQLRYEATHDSLTGLANRSQFTREATARLDLAVRRKTSVAVLLMDLDRFKEVNDTLGHHAGDELLQIVGRRLLDGAPSGALVARLGGDEFAVLLDESCGDPGHVANTLQRALSVPVPVGDFSLDASASIGIARFPEHGCDAEMLVQRADIAMYAAKQSGVPCQQYADGLDHSSPRRLALVSDLRQAVEANELSLHYQPKLSLGDRRVLGVEALVRWDHPTYGMVMPDEFIPIAEHSGLIGRLTRLVIDGAIKQLAEWHGRGWQLEMAVNLSPRTLLDATLADYVGETLLKYHVSPAWLTLELTETTVMTDPERTLPLLNRLHDAGIRISIDDFGTGYSSLAYLRRLPVDEVKIDKSFIRSVGTDADDCAIVRTILELIKSLQLVAVAEGIEDELTRDVLTAMGCHSAQGYLWSRPLAPELFERWLTLDAVAAQRQPAEPDLARRLPA